MKQRRKKKWKLLYKGALDDFDPLESLDYWSCQSASKKFQATTELILDALEMQGKDFQDVQRLLRTTAVFKRQ